MNVQFGNTTPHRLLPAKSPKIVDELLSANSGHIGAVKDTSTRDALQGLHSALQQLATDVYSRP